jgi:hypothetical protein
MNHLESRGTAAHLAEAAQLRAAREEILLMARKMKKAQRQSARAVCQAAQQRTASPKRHFGELDPPFDERALAGLERPELLNLSAIFITERQQAEQIGDGFDAEPRETLADSRPDPYERRDRAIDEAALL